MNILGRLLLVCLACAAAPAGAQQVAVSQRPERVAVTVYRDPERPAEREVDLGWMNGFALISETRRIRIPAGDVEIRFEGVAGNIMPQSAVINGLPEGLIERNYDAYLLSPASLIERSLGRRVHLRRTSMATGAVTEQDAVIRSGAAGALVLQTAEGFEALRCTGLNETVTYDRVPEGVSARPVLSIRTRSSSAVEATITLSYLASGFDWQANYIAYLSPAGDSAELIAWVTLANGDETSFPDAATSAVAGRVNHQVAERRGRWGGGFSLQCWPQSNTSDLPLEGDESIIVTGTLTRGARTPPPPPPALAVAEFAMQAQQEELGDLKLYRIPEPVTIASNSQKQVAFLRQPSVQVDFIYRQQLMQQPLDWTPARRLLVSRNRPDQGLGLPLPAGRLVLFAGGRERPLLIGEGTVTDRAVGEEVEVDLGPAPGVFSRMERQRASRDAVEFLLTVTNDRSTPIRYQAVLPYQRVTASQALGVRNGMPLWSVTIPANGRATLTFRRVD
jgi:hypothetical protein